MVGVTVLVPSVTLHLWSDVSVLDHLLCEHCTELGLGLECTSELLVNRLVNLNISFLAKFKLNLYSYFVT